VTWPTADDTPVPADDPMAMTRPRLVHVTTTDMSLDWLLGPQLVAFREAGYDVAGASAPGAHVEALEARGIRHLPLRHATRSMAPHRDARAFGELYRLFRSYAPDIVHTHNPKPGVYGRLAARAARVPVVVNTVHGLYALPSDPLGKRALVYSLERAAASCSQAELLQNPEDLPVLERLRVPRRKLHLLGNGIDLDRFDPALAAPGHRDKVRADLGIAPSDVVIGAVGRLVAEKGYVELFEAFGEVRRRHPEAVLVVVGPSDESKADALSPALLEAVEREHGVRFLGARDDVVDLYAAMDIYALASHREGFPRSAMEAAAMGLPLVVTDIRGCRQVVDHGVNGSLVALGDVRALTAALDDLVTDGDKRRRLGTAGRDKARREFDQRRLIDITLDVYARCLATAA
jgi:glycosyltransferase involved in cell wall biosynthesis